MRPVRTTIERRDYGYIDLLGFPEASVLIFHNATGRSLFTVCANVYGTGEVLDIETNDRVNGIWQAELAIASHGIEIGDDQQIHAA